MFRWMNARKYRFVKPSLLTTVSAAMLVQACYVPQLLAMESRERLHQSLRQQALRESRFQVDGEAYGERFHGLQRHLIAVAESLAAETPDTAKTADIDFLRTRVSDEYSAFSGRVAELRAELDRRGISSKLIERLDAYIDRKTAEYIELGQEIQTLRRQAGKDPSERSPAALSRVQSNIRRLLSGDARPHPRGKTMLPRRQAEESQAALSQAPLFDYPWQVAALGEGYIGGLFAGLDTIDPADDPRSEDLALEDELAVSQQFIEFVTGAAEGQLRGDPVRIFEYVRNNIVYEPYFGSVKSAERTLFDGRGNDLDQASLLIAMLRVAGVHSRYTFGTIEIDLDDAADWLGIGGAERMVEVLRKGGVPAEIHFEYNQPAAIRLDHVWVSAHVNVEPFRGADSHVVGDTWVPLDPSFKQHSFSYNDIDQALGIQPTSLLINSQVNASVVPIDPTDLWGSSDMLNQSLLGEELTSQAEPLRNYLHQQGLSPDAVYWQRQISRQEFGLFPITDEYRVVEPGAATRSVPEILTHRVKFDLYDHEWELLQVGDADGPLEPLRVSSLTGEMVLLAYEAEAAAHSTIENPPQDFEDFAAAFIRTNARLSVGENRRYSVKKDGEPYEFQPAAFHAVDIKFLPPGVENSDGSEVEVYRQFVRGGGVHAFVVNGQHTPAQAVTDALASIAPLTDPTDDGIDDEDQLQQFTDFAAVEQSVGRSLDAIGQTYFHQIDRYNQMTAGAVGVYATRLPSIARVSWNLISPTPDDPAGLREGPVEIDLVRDMYSATNRLDNGSDGNEDDPTSRFRLISSMLSNTVEVNTIKQILIAQHGVSANSAFSAANGDDLMAESAIVTLSPGAKLVGGVFEPDGPLSGLPTALRDYMIAYGSDANGELREDLEIVVTSLPIGTPADANQRSSDIYGIYVFEPSTGNGALLQFDVDQGAFTSASVSDGYIFDRDYDGLTDVPNGVMLGLDYLDLLHFVEGNYDPYQDVLRAANDTLGVIDGSVENTALWYLPAVANVDEWLAQRQHADPVTIPLSALMLSQPIDRFATEPVLLEFDLAVENPASSYWVSQTGDVGMEDQLSYEALALRATGLRIEFSDADGQTLGEHQHIFDDGGFSSDTGRTFIQLASDFPEGAVAYTAYAYADQDQDGVEEQSVPVSGVFGVDVSPPTITLQAEVPVDSGQIIVSGSAYDALSFDHAELVVRENNSTEVLYSEEFSQPQYSEDTLAIIDTRRQGFAHDTTYDLEFTAWDAAGHSAVLSRSVVSDNPPDPRDIVVDIQNFDVLHGGTSIDGVTIDQQGDSSILELTASVGAISISWDSGDANIVSLDRAEILLGAESVAFLDQTAISSLEDSPVGFSVPFGSIPSQSTDRRFQLRVFASLGDPVDSNVVSFDIDLVPIRDFAVLNDRPTRDSPMTTIVAAVQRSGVDGSSFTGRYWKLAVYNQAPGSSGGLIPASAWEELDAVVYEGTGASDLAGPGAPLHQRVPNGENPNSGDETSVQVSVDFLRAGLDDGEYWLQLIASIGRDDHSTGSSNIAWINAPITVDMSSSPRAVIADTNLPDPSRLADLDDIEHFAPTLVETGFFDLYGYAYDVDEQQQGVEYRVEIRPVDQAILNADRYENADQPVWVAIPPESDGSGSLWSVNRFAGNYDGPEGDEATWFSFTGNDQYRPDDGEPFKLASLDLTGLRDGDYEVALIVRSGGDRAADLGRLALSTPTKVGRFTFSQEDISLPTTGFPMSLVRTYDSLEADVDGPFGLGWSMSIFDLDIDVHEVRVDAGDLYSGLSQQDANTSIRNSLILDRSVSLTLPDGERVTFPFYLQSRGIEGRLYPEYRSPPGHDLMTLEVLGNEYINTLLQRLTWSNDPFHAPEQHHDIRGWRLTLADGTEYTILRQHLSDGFSFQQGNQGYLSEISTVWGDPYIAEIRLPSDEIVDIAHDPATGQISGFTVRNEGDPGSTNDNLIRFVYASSGNGDPDRIVAAFGPAEDPDNPDWDVPLFIYEYDSLGQLTKVARVTTVSNSPADGQTHTWTVTENCPDCDITEFTYEQGEPGLIATIKDPRGLQPAISEYDESGRLLATVDQYGRRVEIARDVENRTETVTDYGASPPISKLYEYDDMGNVVREEHSPSGKIVVREYDEENRLEIEHDTARSNPTIYEYIDLDQGVDRTRVTDPLGNITETDQKISARGVPEFIKTTQHLAGRDPIVTEQLFDARGNLVETISGSTRVVNEYDGLSRLERTLMPAVDEDGDPTGEMVVRTEYMYDADNPALLARVIQHGVDGADPIEQHFLYDLLGRQWASYTLAPDANGDAHLVADVQEYDHAGRVIATYRKISEWTGQHGLAIGNPSTWGSQLTSTHYNSIDQVIASVDLVASTTTTTIYDLRGNVIETAVWPEDLRAYTNFNDLLDWLKFPVGTDMSLDNPPTLIDQMGTYAGDGPVVTRTVYNARGQAEYTSEARYVEADAYFLQVTGGPPSLPQTQITRTVYDDQGRARERQQGSGALLLATVNLDGSTFFTMEADAFNSSGTLSLTEYDVLGRVEKTESYNDSGNAQVTEYEYDENDRQTHVHVTLADGTRLTTEYVYDEAGRQIATIDPRGNRIEYDYDAQGRRTHTSFDDPQLGRETTARTIYDPRGRRISEIDQTGRVRDYTYDQADRLSGVKLIDPDLSDGGASYAYDYDSRGNLMQIADPNGSVTSFAYNHLGQRVSRTLPGSRTEFWSYNNDTDLADPTSGFGKIEYQLDFADTLVHYKYDESGRIERKRYFVEYMGGIPTSEPMQVPDREYVYAYDHHGRVKTITRHDSAGNPDRQTAYVYDEDSGRVRRVYQPEGIIVYDYYPITNRVKSMTTYDGDFSNYAPGTQGSLQRSTLYTYDELGRLSTVKHSTDTTADSSDPTWMYHYNDIGRRAAVEFSDGATDEHVTLYEYDTLGRLTALENRDGSVGAVGGLISAYHYTHNADGRRASVDEIRRESMASYSHMHISYEYDPLGRLISENAADLQGDPTQFGLDFIQGPDPISGVEHPDAPEREFDRTYRYDAAGNRTARITDYTGSADDEYVEYMYAVDVPGSDQLSEVRMYAGLDSNAPHVRTECYDYDANGFMIQKRVDEDTDVNPDDEWVHDYTPDVEGRLASYDRTDLDGSNDISGHVFDYNESGVRVRSGSRHFLVAMQNHTGYAQVLLERSGGAQSAPTRHYAIGDDALGQETALGGLQALLADGHGSTRQLYSGSSSGNNEYYDYDAYGEAFGWELDVPDSSVPRPGTDLLYAGEQWDADLGMQYLRARYYLPGQGVFNRVDPFFGNMDDPQSLHKYAYVHGDPVNRIDPSGTVSITSLSVTMGLSMSIVGVLFLSLGEDPYEDLVRGLLAGARLGAGIAFAINKIFAVAIGVFAAFIQVVIDLISAVESTTGMFLNSLEAFAEGIFDAAVDQFLAVSSLGKATGGVQLLIDLLSELMGQFAAFRDWAATPVRQFSRAMISFVITTAFAAGSQVWPGAVSRRLTSLVASINPINYGSSGANYSDGVADRLADSRFFVDNIEPAISQFFARVGTSLADLF